MKPLALLLICLPALAIESDGSGVKLTDEDRNAISRCSTEGGCKVWTQAEIIATLLIFRQQLLDNGTGCRRNSV